MKIPSAHGMYVPPFGPFGDPAVLVDLAIRAEEAGWDGVFPGSRGHRRHADRGPVDGFTKAPSRVVGARRVHVNCLTPAPIDTGQRQRDEGTRGPESGSGRRCLWTASARSTRSLRPPSPGIQRRLLHRPDHRPPMAET
jgi:hypothetical protein